MHSFVPIVLIVPIDKFIMTRERKAWYFNVFESRHALLSFLSFCPNERTCVLIVVSGNSYLFLLNLFIYTYLYTVSLQTYIHIRTKDNVTKGTKLSQMLMWQCFDGVTDATDSFGQKGQKSGGAICAL